MKKILITGGFGFLGTHLTERLVQNSSQQIHVVDSLLTSPIDLNYYLAEIRNPKNLSYDICPVEKYLTRKKLPRFDEIYHLASPVGPAGVLKHAGEMVRQVARDTYAVSDHCLKSKARLLNVSTSEVYGGGQQGYCSESMAKIVPPKTTVRLEYAVAKLAAETAITNTCRVRGLHAVIVRPFNVAGPRQSPAGGFVLPRFIQQADAGLPITVFGTGKAIRAFSHVKDLVGGFELALRYGKPGEAYNIGNPENKVTILELAQRVVRLISSKSKIIFVDPKTIYGPTFEDANDKFPDAQRAMDELGWHPKHDIDAVIRDAYEDYQKQKRARVLKTDITGENSGSIQSRRRAK